MSPRMIRTISAPWLALWRVGERVGRRLWPDRRAAQRFFVPLMFSVGVHGALLAGIVAAALLLAGPAGAVGGGGTITLEAPTIVEEAPEDEPDRGDSGGGVASLSSVIASSAPSAPSATPTLRGLSSGAPTSLPRLSSETGGGASDVMTALRRREADVSIGATFAGLGAKRATRIVYVVDASGAMVTSLGLVVDELERSISRLAESQRFQVVLYRDRRFGEGGSTCEIFGDEDGASLLRGSAVNKARMASWLRGIKPAGRSNPLDGLRAALALDPDVVFLLARSIPRSGGEGTAGVWGEGMEQTMAELDRLNPERGRDGRRPTVIKTIQFLEDDPTGVMQAIARLHGDGDGSYRVLTLEELRSR